MLLIIILICFLIYCKKASEYRKTTYYKDKKTALSSLWTNKGAIGEYHTYKRLMNYERLGAKFLFNCYLPQTSGKTSEVDMIMIYKSGIYVLESKNYSGWIFGNEANSMWTQTLNAGRKVHKEHFYNPIMQNRTHIKCLVNLLKSEFSYDFTPFSLIVFSDRCVLKQICNTNPLVKVINRYEVASEISLYDNAKGTVFSNETIERIYDFLKPYTEVDYATKQKHIENINNRYRVKEEDILTKRRNTVVNSDKMCPRCGSKLVLRVAQKGKHVGNEFYGCSTYPKCRYVENI